jgi:hypothetical protein
VRAVIVALLLLLGAQLWLIVMPDLGIRHGHPTLIAIAAVLAMIRPVARAITHLLDRIAKPSRRTALLTSVFIFAASTAFLHFQAVHQNRDFGLKYCDESSYRIQTQMAARGRLWEPAHPLAEFFECFQLIATPVYASTYFTGTAMLYAPGVWFGWPHWMMPLLLSGGCVALIYLVFTELVNGIAGWLGALLTISVQVFREQSIFVMAQIPTVFLALLLIWIWIRWRESRADPGAVLFGAIAGWLAVTRPVDALAILIPLLVAVFIDLRKTPKKRLTAVLLACFAGAAPFLAIQLAFNWRVTGNLFQTPFDFYTRAALPQSTYGFHGADPNIRPTWDLPQVQDVYDGLLHGPLARHTPAQEFQTWRREKLPAIFRNLLPHASLMLLLPVGLVGLRGRRWVILAMLPLFVVLYFPYVFFIKHYTLTVLPPVLLLIVVAIEVLANLSQSHRPQVLTFLVFAVSFMTISEWPQFHRTAGDTIFIGGQLRRIDQTLAALPHRPAIVLFRYVRGVSTDEEPVYNTDVAWPDDAAVIRAHDRGEENAKLFDYYAQRQPQRWIYLYNRGDDSLIELGKVRDLAKNSR